MGQTEAIFAHEGWMNSQGHRLNILGNLSALESEFTLVMKTKLPILKFLYPYEI